MKKLILSSLLIAGSIFGAKATIHVVTISGFTFSPSTVNAAVGDTVAWVITGSHTATEVDNATWTADGTTPLGGGFNFNASSTLAGTSWIQVTAIGTRFYVCQVHVGTMSMKGRILVGPSSIDEDENDLSISLYPNPANDVLNININNSNSDLATISVVNVLGSKVMDLGGKQVLTNGVKKIDISTLPKGVYFLNIVVATRTQSMRFVKK